MEDPSATPKRQHERVKAPKIQVRVASLDRLRALYLEDLSQGGIFIRTEKALPLGAAVDIELVPPDSAPLALRGAVVRLATDEVSRRERRAGMAIQFRDLTPEATQALQALVDRLRPPPAPATQGAPAEDATAAARVSALEMELAEMRGRLEAYDHQLKQLEEDEQGSRKLAEKLIHEKTEWAARADEVRGLRDELAVARKDAAAALQRAAELEAELDASRQAQQTLDAALDSERQEHEHTLGELATLRSQSTASAAAQGELRQARQALEEARKRAEALQRQVEEERTRADQAKEREREVRRLLSLMSDAPQPARVAPNPEIADVPWRKEPEVPVPDVDAVVEADDSDVSEVDEEVMAPPAEPALAEPEPMPEPMPEPELARVEAPPPLPVPDVAPDVAAAVAEAVAEELASVEPVAPEPAAPEVPEMEVEVAAAPPPEDFEIAFQEDDKGPPVALPGGAPPPAPAFADRLRACKRIVRSDTFNNYEPTEPAEVFVLDLMTRVDTFDELKKWTHGRIAEARLVDIIQGFHKRSLIALDEGKPSI